jgi:antitoxin VapB
MTRNAMTKREEFSTKRERLNAWLAEHELDGVVLGRSDNFAWLGCGAGNVVNSAQETGVGTLVAERERVRLVASNIEMERLMAEELSGLAVEPAEAFAWHEPDRRAKLIERLCKGKSLAADDGSAGLPALPQGFARLRYSLTEAEVDRYRALGRDAALALETAARAVEKGMTESDVAARTASQCLTKAISPIVLLVAADERIRNWRHPVVKEAKVERYVMVVICGRRHGLIAALTRLVHFGELPEDLRRRHRAVCAVNAAMIRATVPGKAASAVFSAAQAAYAKSGFPDEWQFHHQGGATGYQPREYIATPECGEVVQAGQAFAWNPSIRGTKSEDTILVADDGFEVLTAPSRDWPMVEAEVGGQVIPRADILAT